MGSITLIVECGWPWNWKPGVYRSPLMTRVWWGPFALGWLHVPFREFCETRQEWEKE